ncbi:O-methyltransferase [Flavihumibacter fluvii]|uniref:O-methyltransferase n=1 Tax=Flavihumibacter fluvii TaxID=2838157 RepID=UPI001EFC10DE|nr:O-methyltransferase [Flavihumibacter fluvii]ULQ50675.1 O-methyltransferase [Flavihumibacter fluvii]
MDPINEAVTNYAERFSSKEPQELKDISANTIAVHPQHHMLSGHLQGRFLAMISRLMAPAYILEIGCFTGYSALCLAEGLIQGGQLHSIELRPREAAIARSNFSKSPRSGQLFLHEGEAGSIIPELHFTWDLVFIDADKTGYLNYYELVLPFLRKGGLIIADNVLFHGEVLTQPLKGKNAKAIQAFNEYIEKDERVDKVLVTLRDGLLLLQKK